MLGFKSDWINNVNPKVMLLFLSLKTKTLMTRTSWHAWPGPTWKTHRVSQVGCHRISVVYGKIPARLRIPQAMNTMFSPNSQIYNILRDIQQWWLILLDRYWVFDATLMLSLAHYFLWIKKKKKALKTSRHVKTLPHAGRHHYCKELQCKSFQINHHLFSPPSLGGEKLPDRCPL